ncbi:MAG: hypothetical protein R3A50_05920 [Saprospiraceae bacterium]|nr:hypothetical protein [Saprospiraceae bacterium]MCB9342289.1 hypothetical protein [Lewinellaceae bacterium]
MKRLHWISLIFIALAFSSCDDQSEKIKASVPGYWAVETAFRDKQETQLLKGVFFQFNPDGTMSTNLPNITAENTGYEVKNNIIIQSGNNPMQYEVIGEPDSTLVLSMVISNTPFELHLKKGVPAATPLPEQDTIEVQE